MNSSLDMIADVTYGIHGDLACPVSVFVDVSLCLSKFVLLVTERTLVSLAWTSLGLGSDQAAPRREDGRVLGLCGAWRRQRPASDYVHRGAGVGLLGHDGHFSCWMDAVQAVQLALPAVSGCREGRLVREVSEAKKALLGVVVRP